MWYGVWQPSAERALALGFLLPLHPAMSRRRPPAPKERPVSLAGSTPPRPASLIAPPASPLPPAHSRKGDEIGALVFAVLILLGLIAATRAFLLL